MKRMKKSLSLLLVLCMLLSMLPTGVWAAQGTAAETNAASADSSYRIVQVDAGRKYWSVEVLKQLINEMAKNHYNQLGLYFSDNQGFRFALNNMTFTVDGKNYDLSKALGNGIMQTGASAPEKTEDPNQAHFRPSHEDKWLDETEMKEIISYARKKGIEIVPSFDMPGHMGAILNAPDFEAFKYAGYGKTTNSSFDVTNATAQKVMLAILERYVQFFAANGCRYFNICSDEFCYDIGHSTANSISNPTLCRAIVSFMDEAAKVIVKAKMTPRAFSDYLYADSGYNYSEAYKKYEILFWDKSTNLAECQSRGNKLINVDESCYYALNTAYYTSPDVSVKSFSPDYVATKGSGFALPNPAGAMLCIWCDGGYLDSEPAEGDAGASVLNQVMNFKSNGQTAATNLLAAFAEKVNAYYNVDTSAVVYDLYVGDSVSLHVTGDFSNAEGALALLAGVGDTSAVSVKVENFKAGDPGGGLTQVEAPTAGSEVVVTDGTNFLVVNSDGSFGNTTDASLATRFTIEKEGNNFYLKYNGSKLTGGAEWNDGDKFFKLALGASSTPWLYMNGTLKEAWNTNRYITFDNEWKLSLSAPTTPVVVKASSAAVPASADLVLTGVKVGTAVYTLDGVTYTINVNEKGTEPTEGPTEEPTEEPTEGPTTPSEPEPTVHEHSYTVAATCKHKQRCVCGEEDPNGALNPANHEGPFETRNKKPATTTEPGYTGDTYCTACGTKTAEGKEIPILEPGKKQISIVVEAGGSKVYTMEGVQYSEADTDRSKLDPSIATVEVQPKDADAGGELGAPITQLTIGKSIAIGNGTFFLVSHEDGTVTTTKDPAEASTWEVLNDPSSALLKDQYGRYLRLDEGKSVQTVAQFNGNETVFNMSDGLLKNPWWPNLYITIDESGNATGTAASSENSAGAFKITEPTAAHTDVTITGVKVSDTVTTVVVGDTTIHIRVVDKGVTGVEKKIEYFITNIKAIGETSGANSMTILASDPDVYSDDGVALADVVDKMAKRDANWAAGEGYILTYWKGVRLTSDKKQTGGGKGEDRTLAGDDFQRIRYMKGSWEFLAVDGTWKTINDTDQIVAYYLQVTEVTQEITTEVVDWGYTKKSGDKFDGGERSIVDNYVLLDYRVKYVNSGEVNPKVFPRDLTLSYHDYVGESGNGQVIYDNENDKTRLRRIGMSLAVNSSEYEVYMITVTRSDNDPTVKLKDANGAETNKPSQVATGEIYQGTEYVAWALTEQDAVDSGLPKANDGAALTYGSNGLPSKADAQKGITSYHVGGDPTVYDVYITHEQGLLITYYIRDKHVEEAPLQVYYYDITDGAADKPFFEFGIYTAEPEEFTGRVDDGKDPIFQTTNKYGVLQEVHKDLSRTGCPPYYRTANYQYVECKISTDGKTLDLFYRRQAGEVYVVDFGLPLEVTMKKILEGAQSLSTIDGIASIQINGANLKYGVLSTDFVQAKEVKLSDVVFTYRPTKVMSGTETIGITVNFKEEGADPLVSTITLLPATTVYYEQGFASYTGDWSDGKAFMGGESKQQAALAGDTQKAENPAWNYGYDGAYEAQRDALNSYAGTNTIGAAATFTFTGTGVDIYADCTDNSGSVMMMLTKDGKMERLIIVDTRNKGGDTGATEFETGLTETYNIPIISLRNLEYGTHEVKLIHCESFGEDSKVETRAGGFRFDGFRVYNPMGSDSFAQAQYALDMEANPSYTELRDAEILALNLSKDLLDGSDYAEDLAKDIMSQVNAKYPEGISVSAVVTRQNAGSDVISADLLDNGPKNEIYLRQNESITIVDRNKNSRAQLGMKALSGAVTYQMNGSEAKTLAANVDLFYPMTWTTSDSGSTATVANAGQAPMAVTILKQFSADATAKVTEELVAQLLMQMGVPSAHESDAWENPFTDVHEGAWFYGAVKYVYENGLFKGTTPTTFEPGSNMTRGMLAVVLYRLAGEPETDAANPFTDVKDDAYFAKAVAWAAEQGIVLGRGDGTFAPGEDVTRQDMVVMLYRYAVSVGKTGAAGAETLDFTDADEVLAYAKQAVAWAVANGILKGYDLGGAFALLPGKTINRAEVAAIMERVAPILK